MSNFNVYLEKIQKSKNNNHVHNESVGAILTLTFFLGAIGIAIGGVVREFINQARNKENAKKRAIEIIETYKKENDGIPPIINQDGTINKENVKKLTDQQKGIIYRKIVESINEFKNEKSPINAEDGEQIRKEYYKMEDESPARWQWKKRNY